MADRLVPHFQNEAGVPIISIGSHEFMCIGANPPFDHPHVFLVCQDEGEVICPYCSTLYRLDPSVAPGAAIPPDSIVKDVAA